MKVYLVVVNYNCLVNLKKLLPRVLKEDVDAVYVLDDASTDGSADYIAENFPAIRLIKGTDNRGAGGNRNRIIDERLKGVIFFLDADMELRVRCVGKIIKKQYADKKSAMIGNLILNKSGKPMEWNYGPEM